MTEADVLASALSSLLQEVGKLAKEQGKFWRMDNAELMDSYNAAGDVLDNYRSQHGSSH